MATQKSGARIAYTIKPEVRLRSGRFLDEMQTVAWWVREKGFADDVRLLTDADLDDIDLHNAKVIAAVREADPEADVVARGEAGAITGALALRDLMLATKLEARGYRALLRLLREGHLHLVHRERITPQTLVQRQRASR